MVEKDPNQGESHDEDVNIKRLLTFEDMNIKTLLINPTPYDIIDTTIKLYLIFEYLIPEGKDRGRIIKTLLTILNSQHGRPVLEHILEYGAYTYREIEIKLGISKATIHYITNKLIFIKLVEPKTVVPPFNPKSPGARPIVWMLKGSLPECSVDCISRHYGLLSPVMINGAELKYSHIIQETINYYDQRGRIGTSGPSRVELGQYLKAKHNDLPGPERARLAQMINQDIYKKGKNSLPIVDAETEKAENEEALRRILEIMKPPIKQLTPLYDKLDELGINKHESRNYIKNYFIEHARPNAHAEEE